MDKRGFLRILLILMIMTAYFVTFSSYGAEAYEKIFRLSAGFDEGTKVGPADVSELTKAEALKRLNTQIEKWQDEKKIRLQYVEKEAALDSSIIEFQPRQSVSEAEPGQEKPLLSIVEETAIKNAIEEKFSVLSGRSLDYRAVASDLQDVAAFLQPGETVIDLSIYLKEEEKRKVVAEALLGKEVLTPELEAFIKQTPAVQLKSNTAFSFLGWMEKVNDTALDDDDKNVLSSLLYRLVVQTNFLIFEKNQGSELPSYIELGYEAKVNKVKDLDFIFMNENSADYTIEWKTVNGKLYGAVKGLPFAYEYKGVLKNKETLKPRTILRFSPNLPYGQMQVKRTGEKGELIQMYRTVYDEETGLIKQERVSEDFYPPVYRIEVHSTKEPPEEKPEEPEENTEISADGTEKAPDGNEPKKDELASEAPAAQQPDEPAAGGEKREEAK